MKIQEKVRMINDLFSVLMNEYQTWWILIDFYWEAWSLIIDGYLKIWTDLENQRKWQISDSVATLQVVEIITNDYMMHAGELCP